MFSKVLVANRGEIARRVLCSCARLGIQTVAIYSSADEHSLHAREADEAALIGGPRVEESYLRGDAIIAVAKERGAEAIHPGYGLLSENADFAAAVAAAGLVFIGPSPEAITILGSKLRSRELARQARVPVLPASGPLDPDDPAAIIAAAEALGYPVLVKLSGGGGGIGMSKLQRPEKPKKIAKAVAKAARRGESSFGDGTVYLERALERPRHIEVQLLFDHHGAGLHLLDRDCSTQRRHQKVIEEAPAPGLDEALRERLTSCALRLGAAVGYRGVGTVEFLLDEDGAFYFLEMNTRLQVEHPVTEAITGLDLVELQLRVAAGEPLPLRQADVVARGHAIELRIYAEDPVRFLPQPGTVERWIPPSGEGVRVDDCLFDGMVVTPYYDPMLGKVIIHGASRAEAIERALRALRETTLDGLIHNLPLHTEILSSERFRGGAVHTGLIDELRTEVAS